MKNRSLILGIAILSLSFGCKHIPKPEPGSVQLFVSGETAVALRAIMGHTAISPWEYGTLWLVSPNQVTPYLACHERFHTNTQAVRYESTVEYEADYLAKFVKSLVTYSITNGRTDTLNLVLKVLRGELKPSDVSEDDVRRIVAIGYANHEMELEAIEACKEFR